MKCPFCGSNRGYYQIERVHRVKCYNKVVTEVANKI